MKPAWHKYLTRNVPRYTSYPSALAFREGFEKIAYERALAQIAEGEPLSLYIHIPFCKKLCWYCGCNMRVENKAERILAFVDDLLCELDLVAGKLGGRGRLRQVHFGGGTPNTLSTDDLTRILSAVRERFTLPEGAPVVMEIDPRLHPGEAAGTLAKAGITRFSIGVQDFDPGVQQAINRVQPFSMVEGVVSALRQEGAADISLDVLYGLPKQTLCGFRRTVEQVIALKPDRVSLFGYAHLPERLPHQRLILESDLPSRPLRIALEESAASMLVAAGYERIGFDHYALAETSIAKANRAKRLHRNFQGFTEDDAHNVIGLGPSAISTVDGVLAQNAKDLRAYRTALSEGKLPIERGVIASLEEEDLGSWLKRLVCDLEGDLRQYCDITGANIEEWERTSNELAPLIEDGIVRIENDTIFIAEEAKPLARLVASVFDPACRTGQGFASPAV
ncbi:MAG: oxygen-independent coproporphyrinogen III oxidase [Parvularcula sp.]|jgi:oxygen-independent coproporphyrinogen-3 oxidase|nr:oxygen-independent coproporphyrinogen III oxidase [Parvularcula sp.]